MDPQRVTLLVVRYRTLAWWLAAAAVLCWWLMVSLVDGPRSLDLTLALWSALAVVSTVACATSAVLAGVWAATGRVEKPEQTGERT